MIPGDTLTFETFDGNTLVLPSTVFAYEIFPGNFGIPPVNYITRQGYKQHGTTEIDYILSQRQFDIEFWRASACDRQTYWDNRSDVLEFFRPNRNGPMTFTVTQADGTQRSLIVRPDPGPQFGTQQSNDWNIRETLSFIAFDPIWFDPTQTSYAPTSSSSSDLIFPITFPISFGASGLLFTQAITYAGTWASFPTLRVDGPYTEVTVTNLATGISIFFNVPISAGQFRILDLTPGAQSLIDENGDDAFGDLGPTSNLVNFCLQPDPIVASGVQTIRATFRSASGASAFTISFNNRYIGI